jgi:hypothetical protein
VSVFDEFHETEARIISLEKKLCREKNAGTASEHRHQIDEETDRLYAIGGMIRPLVARLPENTGCARRVKRFMGMRYLQGMTTMELAQSEFYTRRNIQKLLKRGRDTALGE